MRIPVVAAVGMFALGIAVVAGAPQAGAEKRVIVTVLDAQTNKPVTGLPADAFAIREDNLDCQVLKAEPATEPMSVVLLTDTTFGFVKYVRDLRAVSVSFVQKFMAASPTSSLALWEFGGADIPIVNFTSDEAKLETAAAKLYPKGSLSDTSGDSGSAVNHGQNIVGSNLLEAVIGSAKQLAKRPETRRVIVSFNSDESVENSKMPGQQVQDEVQKAGATWFAVSLQGTVANGPLRDNVINNLTPYSGGKRITVQGIASLQPALDNVVDILQSQYVITYKRAGAAAKIVLVGVKREGLKASTPRWAPK